MRLRTGYGLALIMVLHPALSMATKDRFIPMQYDENQPAYLQSTVLYPPGSDEIPNYYTLCAHSRKEAEGLIKDILAHANHDTTEAELDDPDSAYTDEFRSKMKDPAARAAYLAEKKQEGYMRKYEFVTLKETDEHYDFVLQDVESREEGHEYLYKCSAYQQAKTLPEGFNEYGADYKGVTGKTVLDPKDPEKAALDFIRKQTQRGQYKGIYNMHVTRTPERVTVNFNKALASSQDWNIPDVIYYLNHTYIFDLATHEIYEKQKKYATGTGEVNENILKQSQ